MKKLCNIHGTYTTDRCSKCRKNSNKTYDKIFRNEESKKFYSSSLWRKVRTIALNLNPSCSRCNRPATMVDHTVEIVDGGAKLSLDNLEPMCLPCHNKKTAEAKARRVGGAKSLQTKPPLTDPPSQKTETPCEGG